jgi:putative Mg2+ transporter-C (MgtC) family protein
MFMDNNWVEQLVIIGQVLVAMILGGFIGYERQLANKPAGLRTHMLVAGASSMFMGISGAAASYYQPELGGHGVEADLLRVAAGIMSAAVDPQ